MGCPIVSVAQCGQSCEGGGVRPVPLNSYTSKVPPFAHPCLAQPHSTAFAAASSPCRLLLQPSGILGRSATPTVAKWPKEIQTEGCHPRDSVTRRPSAICAGAVLVGWPVRLRLGRGTEASKCKKSDCEGNSIVGGFLILRQKNLNHV